MWSEERTALLRKLWAEGLSASQIAKQLGGVTRNAVIGKVHRLGLAGRASQYKATTKRPQRRTRVRFIPPSVLRPIKVRPPTPSAEDLHNLPPEGALTIETVRDGQCKYMAGEGPDALVCGRSTPLGSWCSLHVKLVYQPSRKRQLEDASIARVTHWLDRKSRTFQAAA